MIYSRCLPFDFDMTPRADLGSGMPVKRRNASSDRLESDSLPHRTHESKPTMDALEVRAKMSPKASDRFGEERPAAEC